MLDILLSRINLDFILVIYLRLYLCLYIYYSRHLCLDFIWFVTQTDLLFVHNCLTVCYICDFVL